MDNQNQLFEIKDNTGFNFIIVRFNKSRFIKLSKYFIDYSIYNSINKLNKLVIDAKLMNNSLPLYFYGGKIMKDNAEIDCLNKAIVCISISISDDGNTSFNNSFESMSQLISGNPNISFSQVISTLLPNSNINFQSNIFNQMLNIPINQLGQSIGQNDIQNSVIPDLNQLISEINMDENNEENNELINENVEINLDIPIQIPLEQVIPVNLSSEESIINNLNSLYPEQYSIMLSMGFNDANRIYQVLVLSQGNIDFAINMYLN